MTDKLEENKNSTVSDFIEAVKALDGYEYREPQLKMVETIDNALNNEKNAVIEAGTGSGKSFAYLFPLIKSGKTAVISTGTIALQEQLLDKDIPFLKQSSKLPEFNAVIAKGRSNYVCKQKLYEVAKSVFPNSPIANEVELLLKQSLDKWDGDFSNLPFQISNELKREIESTSEDCIMSRCEFFSNDRAPFFNARKKLAKADIVITNHSLYMSDLITNNSILPEHDIVVFDESHHLYTNAVNAFTARVGRYSIQKIIQKIQKRVNKIPENILTEIMDSEIKLFEWVFKFNKPIVRLTEDQLYSLRPVAENLYQSLRMLRKWLDFIPVNIEMFPDDENQIKGNSHKQNLLKQLDNLMKRWDLFIDLESSHERVNWLDIKESRAYFEFHSAPLFVENHLKDGIWERVVNDENKMKAILTSATISVGNNFEYLKKQLGIEEALELVLPSPFDYENQAALYIPEKIPDPNSDLFIEACKNIIIETLKVSQGRAFLLFSSWRNMENAFNALKGSIPYPIRKQGDLTRKNIIEWFKNTPNSVLFATATFWEGIDIPGDSLSCVIIDKLPFSVPDDPFIQAKVDYMKENNLNWFMDYMLPEAVIKLRQGVGRLIRTKTDKGLLVIMDNRIVTKFYGKTVIKSLPPVKKLKKLEEAKKYL